MIRAMIFDLDGTLVQTERLKALSYARATVELCPHALSEQSVVDMFKQVVGLSRYEVAMTLIERFDLEQRIAPRMAEFQVGTAWQAFVQIRLQYYNEILADPEVLRANQWPHNVEMLRLARTQKCATALATMSHCEQANHVLAVLGLRDQFNFVATRDDVSKGKPDPEIYELVARELAIAPSDCLVIEDSPAGVQAALAAGMWCIAVTTPFTREQINSGNLLDPRWIVNDPVLLPAVCQQMFEEQAQSI